MRLIDADALEQRIKYRYLKTVSPQILVDTLGWALRRVRNAPTVDPAKHGHWEYPQNDSGLINPRCSNCKRYNPHVVDMNFCMRCGAKMDQVVSE